MVCVTEFESWRLLVRHEGKWMTGNRSAAQEIIHRNANACTAYPWVVTIDGMPRVGGFSFSMEVAPTDDTSRLVIAAEELQRDFGKTIMPIGVFGDVENSPYGTPNWRWLNDPDDVMERVSATVVTHFPEQYQGGWSDDTYVLTLPNGCEDRAAHYWRTCLPHFLKRLREQEKPDGRVVPVTFAPHNGLQIVTQYLIV